jgi:hypothetical protein
MGQHGGRPSLESNNFTVRGSFFPRGSNLPGPGNFRPL